MSIVISTQGNSLNIFAQKDLFWHDAQPCILKLFLGLGFIYQGGLVRDFANLFNNTDVELPIDEDGKIDFSYMENRVRELEAERIRELETYLKASLDWAITSLRQPNNQLWRNSEKVD